MNEYEIHLRSALYQNNQTITSNDVNVHYQ
jgi:hypothetical protein